MIRPSERQGATGPRQALIVGGGVAGLEALLALHDLAGERAALAAWSPPSPTSSHKPLLVEEPFDLGPAERHELEPIANDHGAEFIRGASPRFARTSTRSSSTTGRRAATTISSSPPGGVPAGARDGDHLPSAGELFRADWLLDRAEAATRIAFIVPGGVGWPLPSTRSR